MTPHARTALLEWAVRSAAGELEGLDWVDAELRDQGIAFRVRLDDDTRPSFAGTPRGAVLPPPVVAAVRDASQRGEPSAFEALGMIIARAEWLIATRDLWWAPTSPVPDLLTALVEAFGVDVELHQGDHGNLARLTALLPQWFPVRGRLETTARMVARGLADTPPIHTAPPTPGARELFTCRSAAWHRSRGTRPVPIRIASGYCWTPLEASRVLPQDQVLGWVPGAELPREVFRLLPAWGSLRLHEVPPHG